MPAVVQPLPLLVDPDVFQRPLGILSFGLMMLRALVRVLRRRKMPVGIFLRPVLRISSLCMAATS
jgi:hypothetical protein